MIRREFLKRSLRALAASQVSPFMLGRLAQAAAQPGSARGLSPRAAGLLEAAESRIEQARKADVTIRVITASGKPVAGAEVKVEQVRHAFLFGCNIFPLFRYTGEQHDAYGRQFAALLNYATLPFYWGAYEPQPGKTNAESNERIARWCHERGITTKGHPLVWHNVYPAWAPSDPDAARTRLHERVTEAVSQFKGLIDKWDVVNEATVSEKFDNGLGRWVRRDGAARVVAEALEWARAADPGATLIYNDFNVGPQFERLVADLVAARRPLDAIGIQSHMHRGEWPLERVWEVCETYSRFGRPLHFTEVTVLSGEHGWQRPRPWPSTPDGEAQQAEYAERFYTLLFSHPAVEAITWWDFMDGGWMDAPGGLVRADLAPKPVYTRLLALVTGRWWTHRTATTDASGSARVRGFLGRYRATAMAPEGNGTGEFDLRRTGDPWTIRIG